MVAGPVLKEPSGRTDTRTMSDLADAGPCEDTRSTAWPSPAPTTPTRDLPPPPSAGPVWMNPPSVSTAISDDAAGCGAIDDPATDPVPSAMPSIISRPAAVLTPDHVVLPVDHGALRLPDVVATPSTNPTTAVLSSAPDIGEPARPVAPAKRTNRRVGRAVVALAVLGGLGYVGATYGPGLYDDYVTDSGTDEPAAPMSFPRVRAGGADVRTATFVLDGFATGSDAVDTITYTITVDFETNVSRVIVDRESAPDLEVLTFSDDALVRRIDSEVWFQLDRGSFPFDEQLRRTDWVRVVDDLLPVDQRAGVVIDESTDAEIGGVPTRHLTVTLDPSALRPAQPEVLDPMAAIAAAAGADGSFVDPVAPPPPADGEPVRIELWIDGEGVVRKSVGTEVLGAQSITILETTSDPWIPDYPSEAQVDEITAASLIELGL